MWHLHRVTKSLNLSMKISRWRHWCECSSLSSSLHSLLKISDFTVICWSLDITTLTVQFCGSFLCFSDSFVQKSHVWCPSGFLRPHSSLWPKFQCKHNGLLSPLDKIYTYFWVQHVFHCQPWFFILLKRIKLLFGPDPYWSLPAEYVCLTEYFWSVLKDDQRFFNLWFLDFECQCIPTPTLHRQAG